MKGKEIKNELGKYSNDYNIINEHNYLELEGEYIDITDKTDIKRIILPRVHNVSTSEEFISLLTENNILVDCKYSTEDRVDSNRIRVSAYYSNSEDGLKSTLTELKQRFDKELTKVILTAEDNHDEEGRPFITEDGCVMSIYDGLINLASIKGTINNSLRVSHLIVKIDSLLKNIDYDTNVKYIAIPRDCKIKKSIVHEAILEDESHILSYTKVNCPSSIYKFSINDEMV